MERHAPARRHAPEAAATRVFVGLHRPHPEAPPGIYPAVVQTVQRSVTLENGDQLDRVDRGCAPLRIEAYDSVRERDDEGAVMRLGQRAGVRIELPGLVRA